MERVTGIGGLFLSARDPDRLQAWYADHLGVTPPPPTYDDPDWQQQAGPTVLAFGPEQSAGAHVGPRGIGLSFRVADLPAMVAQLRAAGVAVEVDPEAYPNGRFAALHDPEGNPVQLWQPHQ